MSILFGKAWVKRSFILYAYCSYSYITLKYFHSLTDLVIKSESVLTSTRISTHDILAHVYTPLRSSVAYCIPIKRLS